MAIIADKYNTKNKFSGRDWYKMASISYKYNTAVMPAIKRFALIFAALLLLPPYAAGEPAEPRDGAPFTIAGDILFIAIPASTVVYSTAIKDYDGLKSLVFTGGSTLLVTLGLKYAVGRPRPYQEAGERGTSFPSLHAASAFCGAAYWQRRYGWHAGIPAYALAAATGYSRVWGNYHYWSDVAAGAAIGTAAAYIFTKPYNKDKEQKVQISAGATMSSAQVIINYNF
jgi:membrane-associated phospholipid phosphatase